MTGATTATGNAWQVGKVPGKYMQFWNLHKWDTTRSTNFIWPRQLLLGLGGVFCINFNEWVAEDSSSL